MRRGRLRKLQAGLLLPWSGPPYGFQVDPERLREPGGASDPTRARTRSWRRCLLGTRMRSAACSAKSVGSGTTMSLCQGPKGDWNVTTLRFDAANCMEADGDCHQANIAVGQWMVTGIAP